MTTKEIAERSVEGWTTRYNGRARVEPEDSHLARMVKSGSDGQGTDAQQISESPSGERVNETRKAYRQSLKHHVDATYVNVGTVCVSPSGVGQPASKSRKRDGAAVVVRDEESLSHGEGRQFDQCNSSMQTKREDGCMDRLKIAEKQRALAIQASSDPRHRFVNLYDLLHWDKWIHCAAQAVLSRPGSDTAGVDGKTRNHFNDNYGRLMAELKEELKRKRFKPQPVRRAYIPKAKGKRRPLGIPALKDRIVQEALRMALDPIYESGFQPYSSDSARDDTQWTPSRFSCRCLTRRCGITT